MTRIGLALLLLGLSLVAGCAEVPTDPERVVWGRGNAGGVRDGTRLDPGRPGFGTEVEPK